MLMLVQPAANRSDKAAVAQAVELVPAFGEEQLSQRTAPRTVPHSCVNDTPPAASVVGTSRLPTRGR